VSPLVDCGWPIVFWAGAAIGVLGRRGERPRKSATKPAQMGPIGFEFEAALSLPWFTALSYSGVGEGANTGRSATSCRSFRRGQGFWL